MIQTAVSSVQIVSDNPKGHGIIGDAFIHRNSNKVWPWVRFLLVDIPLVATFAAVLLLQGLGLVYEEYYVPLMDRATRTDQDLQEEHTYYHRTCSAADIYTPDADDLLADVNAPIEEGVHQIMRLGALVIPNLLPLDTVQKLREYAVYRNRVIQAHEEYPVSQGTQRKSFGYDATEHPALAEAVQKVTQNPYLRQLLPALLGDVDPASTEITTITQYYGAPEMYWHPDTKPDGNAVKYARTYSHSYSLFVSLQNTTHPMGATEFCLGSHYCGDEDLVELCREHAIGLHSATPEQVFRAGDGAMFNQHTWHRAPPHVDPDAPERIMFIMSFLARPKPLLDQRQLSRGTYFHQKWNMWGHTWQDLQDPLHHMAWPWSVFKCLSLWTRTGHWGYDLVTATYMRFSNGQLGSDLTRLVDIWDNVLKWPTWLHGPNQEYDLPEKQAWQEFIQQTINILKTCAQRIALTAHVAYLLGLLLCSWAARESFNKCSVRPTPRRGGPYVLKDAARRLFGTHGAVLLIFCAALSRIRTCEWGRGVLSGQVLKRPFPRNAILRDDEQRTFGLQGPTTIPIARDVLLGTRFDAPWLGSYERWLDWHPGNQEFQYELQQLAPWFAHYKHAHVLFQSHILNRIRQSVTRNGARFLRQDYRTGDWRILTFTEQMDSLKTELVFSSNSILRNLGTLFKRLIGVHRFTSANRESMLARKSVVYLTLLQNKLTNSMMSQHQGEMIEARHSSTQTLSYSFILQRRATNFMLAGKMKTETFKNRAFKIPPAQDDPFPIGYPVWLQLIASENDSEDPQWFRGDVIDCPDNDDGHYTVGLERGEEVFFVYPVARYEPVTEGDVIMACNEAGLEDCYPAHVLRVRADGTINAVFILDGDDDEEFPYIRQFGPGEYYQPPFDYNPWWAKIQFEFQEDDFDD